MSLWDDAAPIHRNIGDLNTLASLLNNGGMNLLLYADC
jgi:hypothetical protein